MESLDLTNNERLDKLKNSILSLSLPDYIDTDDNERLLKEIYKDIKAFLSSDYHISIVDKYNNDHDLVENALAKTNLVNFRLKLKPMIDDFLKWDFESDILVDTFERFLDNNLDTLKNDRKTDKNLLEFRNMEIDKFIGESKAWENTLLYALSNNFSLIQIYYVILELVNNVISQKYGAIKSLYDYIGLAEYAEIEEIKSEIKFTYIMLVRELLLVDKIISLLEQ